MFELTGCHWDLIPVGLTSKANVLPIEKTGNQ